MSFVLLTDKADSGGTESKKPKLDGYDIIMYPVLSEAKFADKTGPCRRPQANNSLSWAGKKIIFKLDVHSATAISFC